MSFSSCFSLVRKIEYSIEFKTSKNPISKRERENRRLLNCIDFSNTEKSSIEKDQYMT